VKILVTARSSVGKSYFCNKLLQVIDADYFNNDQIRSQTENWDFSPNGRFLAAQNMRQATDQSAAKIKLIDMICPTPELRSIIAPDVIVFIDSDESSKYPDTDALYVKPTKNEAPLFFSCWTRKVDELVDRLVILLKNV
jgi:adenylylsulfate kinase